MLLVAFCLPCSTIMVWKWDSVLVSSRIPDFGVSGFVTFASGSENNNAKSHQRHQRGASSPSSLCAKQIWHRGISFYQVVHHSAPKIYFHAEHVHLVDGRSFAECYVWSPSCSFEILILIFQAAVLCDPSAPEPNFEPKCLLDDIMIHEFDLLGPGVQTFAGLCTLNPAIFFSQLYEFPRYN